MSFHASVMTASTLIALALSGGSTFSQDVQNESAVFDSRFAGALELEDFFGYAVAATERQAIVGAYNFGPCCNPVGGAFVFERGATGWSSGTLLEPSDSQSAWFGQTVALSDGVALVGAPFTDSGGLVDSGRVYAFEPTGSTWSEVQQLHPADLTLGNRFGNTIAIDGNRALISAPADATASVDAGSAYIFQKISGTWVEQAKLLPPPGAGGAGVSVALHGDVAVLGAPVTPPATFGTAYVFEKTAGVWVLSATLFDPVAGSGDMFGWSVAVHGDVIAVGEPTSESAGTHPGSVFMYERSGGSWPLLEELRASDGFVGLSYNDQFGHSVSLHEDRLLVGAKNALVDSQMMGKAYIFERGATSWEETIHLVSSQAGFPDQAGKSVALVDGTAFVGAYTAAAYGIRSGEAYIFDLPLGERYCPAAINSTGQAASLTVTGSTLSDVGPIHLVASGLPVGRPAMFIAGLTPVSVPSFAGGQGTLCVAPPMRLPPVHVTSGAGSMELDVDPAFLLVSAGQTWHFQGWYRDVNPMPTFNLTDAVAVTYR